MYGEEEKDIMTVMPDDIAAYDYESIIAVAENADKLVKALNKIMQAAIKITTPLDWVLIGGKPYLQESGATKVARLFGISWKILDVKKEIKNGYPAFTYRMQFTMGTAATECEGMRSGDDDFFTGRGNTKKSPDEINAFNVQKSAYTNCLNNGIKRLLPGLRNIDIDTLSAGGIDTRKLNGYTFKSGSQGGTNQNDAEESGLVCDSCGTSVTQKVASYSQAHCDGSVLCMPCQKKHVPGTAPAGKGRPANPSSKNNPPAPPPADDDGYIPPEPPARG